MARSRRSRASSTPRLEAASRIDQPLVPEPPVFAQELYAELDTGRRAFSALLAREADRPIALTASHGDYVPWNVLSGRPRPAVWDWERFDRAVPAGSDRIHYRFQVGVQRAHRGVVDVMASIAGELDTILAGLDILAADADVVERRRS